MIIFYKPDTGEVVGTINGRIHTDVELGMSMGENCERLVVNWVQSGLKLGIGGNNELVEQTADFSPDHEQKELFEKIDNEPNLIYNYIVKNNQLIEKDAL